MNSGFEFLPEWGRRTIINGKINTSMPSLKGYYDMLRTKIEGIQPYEVAHVSLGCPCPTQLLYGVVHYHASNGTIVAGSKEHNRIYMRCTKCQYSPPTTASTEALAEILQGSESNKIPWVVITEAICEMVMNRHKGKNMNGKRPLQGTYLKIHDNLTCPVSNIEYYSITNNTITIIE